MSLDAVAPTRMNMLAKRAQIKLAADGVTLLEGKREALLKELLTRARELRALRNELHERGRRATAELSIACAVRSTPELQSAAIAGRRELDVGIKTERVWGLQLGTADQHRVVRNHTERGLGTLDTSSHTFESAEAAELMVEQLIKCAPVEMNIQLIGEEVKKTSRRINALEEYLLPKLRGEVHMILSVLEEREREDRFRLKRIKKKKEVERRAKQLQSDGQV
jgi:V/A-type H+/Na+-transporting ATPase subunit D